MWSSDTVTFQTKVDTNVNGSISTVWTDSTTVSCDVQDISKEFAFKTYGITSSSEMRQVFDQTLSDKWVVGNQVKYDSKQWWVKLVNNSNAKMWLSNHVYVILARVI